MARQMKESGIEWIGNIPESWSIKKGKNLYDIATGKLDANAEVPEGQFPFFTCSMYPKQIDTYAFDCEALLVAGNGLVGFTQYYNGKFNAYQRTYVLSNFRYVVPMFLKFYVSNNLSTEVAPNSVGSVIQFIKLGDLQNFHIAIPDMEEQEKIATYLEEKCAEIDAVIEKTKATIEEYKKLKQSVITEAVTKGIRGDRPMKDSGIEWIGEIPVEWSIEKLKNMFAFGKGLPITKENLQDNGVSVISYGQIHSKLNTGIKVIDELIRCVSDEFLDTNQSSLVNQGDFIVADTSEDLNGCGNCVYVDRQMQLFAGYHCVILRAFDKIHSPYLAYLFLADSWRSQLRCRVSGIKLFSITQKILRETTVILPSTKEQEDIVEYLDKKCAEIDSLITKKTNLLTELENYKKSLIYEYVTGKKECSERG